MKPLNWTILLVERWFIWGNLTGWGSLVSFKGTGSEWQEEVWVVSAWNEHGCFVNESGTRCPLSKVVDRRMDNGSNGFS